MSDPDAGINFELPPPLYLRRQVLIPVALLALIAAGLAMALLRRRRREAAERMEAERRIQSILDHTPAVIFIKAPDGKYQFINRRFEAMFHVSRQDIRGKTDFEVFPRDVAEVFRRNDARVARDQSAELIEEQAPHDDGMHTYISAKFPLVDAKGKTTAVCGIATDITPRKVTEQKLAERMEHAALSAKVATAFCREGALSAILTRTASAMIDHLGAFSVRIWTQENHSDVRLQTHVRRNDGPIHDSQAEETESPASAAPEATNAPLIEPGPRGGVTARYSLIVQNRVVGVMLLEFDEAPNEATTGTIKAVADTIAMGIERFRVTETLLHEQTFLKTLLTSVSEGIVACDAEGNLTLFNRALREMHGREPGTFGETWEGPLEIFDAASGEPVHQSELPLMRALRGEEVHDAELIIRKPDGSEVSCLSSGRPMITADGRALGAVVAVRDVTRKRQAEEALRYSEERLRATLGQAAVGISETDPDGRYLLVNQRFCDIVGYTREELLQLRFQDITYPEDLVGDLERFCHLLTGRIGRYALEKRYIRKDKTLVWVSLTVSAVQATAKKPGYVIAVIEDITQRRSAEESIRRQALVFENIMDSVLVLDANGIIVDCNPAAQRMFGYSRELLIGSSPEMLNHPLEGPLISASINEGLHSGNRWEGEVRFVRPDKSEGLCEVIVVPLLNERHQQVGTVSVNRDITARRRAEEEKALLQAQLFQAQKMEAVGTLASGIAHDFAHLLSAISTMTELAKGSLPVDHPAGVSLDHLTKAARHAQGVVRALLTYSHRGPLTKKHFNVKSAVDGAVEVARSLRMPPTIELSADTEAGASAWVFGDEMLIRQAIINLALNARDAMPGGGQFRVSLNRDGRRPGHIRICAEDTGLGMTPEVRARIFEPYFTTKSREEATGLGMSLIHSIVTGHGGTIDVDSAPSRGTKITITLPCSDAAPLTEAAPSSALAGVQILVLVSAEHVRSIITSALRNRGYEVRAEGRLSEAEDLLSNGEGATRLVILDLPPASGRKLSRFGPQLDSKGIRRLILQERGEEELPESANPLVSRLAKPFEIPELLEAVATALLMEEAPT
ncbi:MAG TPA: PAS domain S-box protein [Phycisphaerae bacterium]|nr:PAS domain S-box protein [Phycisphaerae bacterium]